MNDHVYYMDVTYVKDVSNYYKLIVMKWKRF